MLQRFLIIHCELCLFSYLTSYCHQVPLMYFMAKQMGVTLGNIICKFLHKFLCRPLSSSKPLTKSFLRKGAVPSRYVVGVLKGTQCHAHTAMETAVSHQRIELSSLFEVRLKKKIKQSLNFEHYR